MPDSTLLDVVKWLFRDLACNRPWSADRCSSGSSHVARRSSLHAPVGTLRFHLVLVSSEMNIFSNQIYNSIVNCCLLRDSSEPILETNSHKPSTNE